MKPWRRQLSHQHPHRRFSMPRKRWGRACPAQSAQAGVSKAGLPSSEQATLKGISLAKHFWKSISVDIRILNFVHWNEPSIMAHEWGTEVLNVSIITSRLWQAPAVKALFGTQGRCIHILCECSLRCKPVWKSRWQEGSVWSGRRLTEAKRGTTGTLERSAGQWSFVVWGLLSGRTAGVMQHLIYLTRQLHRKLKQQTLPGTHLPPFIEEFKAFETACQVRPTFHILVAALIFGKHLRERVPLLSVDWALRLALAKRQQLLPTRQERFN